MEKTIIIKDSLVTKLTIVLISTVIFKNLLTFTAFQSIGVNLLLEMISRMLILLLLIFLKDGLYKYNISLLSIFLIVISPTFLLSSYYSSEINHILQIANYIISATIIVLFLYLKVIVFDNSNVKKIIKSIFFLFFGLLLGFSLSFIIANHFFPWVINIVLEYPKYILTAIFFSFQGMTLNNEFIFRGFLWRLLKKKELNHLYTVIITSILWSLFNFTAASQLNDLTSAIVLSIIMGISVLLSKDIITSLGVKIGHDLLIIINRYFV